MIVYKFGGASVRSAEGVRNVAQIIGRLQGPCFIVVSAMGKTTNALEEVVARFMENDNQRALAAWREIIAKHRTITTNLFAEAPSSDRNTVDEQLSTLCNTFETLITNTKLRDDYDRCYDQIVPYGELLSTTIIYNYLISIGLQAKFVDMRQVLITDSLFREATVKLDTSAKEFAQLMHKSNARFFVGQGFIGANSKGESTTLGREGSDYTAAVVGYLLEAKSVTIWKDVPGILNADPRYFDHPVLIPELTYLDAIELAYSGAQIIHPKTIKPLQLKNIPLYVRPFGEPNKAGSVIHETIAQPITIPILILKRDQVLLSVRTHDMSFLIGDKLTQVFGILNHYRQKINLLESSAISLTVCLDDSRQRERLIDALQTHFRVTYNTAVELITLRSYTEELLAQYTDVESTYLLQKTRFIARVVRKIGK